MYLTILTLAHHVYTSEPASSFPFSAPKIALVLRFTSNPTELVSVFGSMNSWLTSQKLVKHPPILIHIVKKGIFNYGLISIINLKFRAVKGKHPAQDAQERVLAGSN